MKQILSGLTIALLITLLPSDVYTEINQATKCPTDECIQEAIKEVCKRRNITDSATIETILRNYYL